MRLGSVLLLGLLLGCGGGGGDGYDGVWKGAYWTAVDINTSPCGPPVNDVTGSDLTDIGGGRIRLDLYLESTADCLEQTWTVYGTKTSETTADMDEVADDFLCVLEHEYGYGFFDITNFTLTVYPDYIQLQGDLEIEYGSTGCFGSIFITLDED